jgi:hypothetical protein
MLYTWRVKYEKGSLIMNSRDVARMEGHTFPSTQKRENEPSKFKTFGFAVLIIFGIGGLVIAGVGTGGLLHAGSLTNLGQANSIIMIVIGGVSGIPLLVIGIIGFVNTYSGSRGAIKDKTTIQDTNPQEEKNKTEARKKAREEETDISQNRELDAKSVLIKASTVNPLSVERVTADHFPEITEELQLWQEMASAKYLKVHDGKAFCPQTRSEAASDIGLIFKSSLNMIEPMYDQVANPPEKRPEGGEPWDSILICRDKSNKIQAIAFYEEQTNKLGYLATHPDNIRHPFNDAISTRVQGAGTQVMLAMMKLALINNKPILLRSTKEAVSFYKKLHFEVDHANRGPYDGYEGITPMKLTVEKIKDLMIMELCPFNYLKDNLLS